MSLNGSLAAASGNVTSDNEYNPWDSLNVPYTVCEVLVAVAAVIGNALVIAVFGKERKLRRKTKYYIISLAVADFLVGLLGVPFAILASVGLPRNFHLCLFTVSLLVVLCTISIFCLVAVSVDRYWAILYPMSYSRNVRSRTAIGIIIVCWLAGALVGFLPLLGWNEGGHFNRRCLFVEVMDYDYLVFLYFATIIAPALLMAGFYANIYCVVLRQLRQIVLMSPAALDDGSRSSPARSSGVMLRVLGAAQKREVKATQNLSIIVLFFIICWIPLYTINCVKAFCPSCHVSPTLTYFCIILSHLNSSFNPLLYAYHLKDFRTALHKLIFQSNDQLNAQVTNYLRYDSTLHIPRNEVVPAQHASLNSSLSSIMKEEGHRPTNGVIAQHLWTVAELPSVTDPDRVSGIDNSSFVFMNVSGDVEDDVFVAEPLGARRPARRARSIDSFKQPQRETLRGIRSLSESHTLDLFAQDIAGIENNVRKLLLLHNKEKWRTDAKENEDARTKCE